VPRLREFDSVGTAHAGPPKRPPLRGPGATLLLALIGLPVALGQDAAAQPGRIERLNQAFLHHVRSLDPAYALARTTILDGWVSTYRGELAESFVPDALAVLYPVYRDALQAFDDERPADVVRLLEPLRQHDDRFLAANADYFYVRALVALGRYEQAEAALASVEARKDEYAVHTPYAPHLWFMRGFCETRNLRFEQAARSLEALRAQFDDAPEAVRVGAAQLLLELERRERGTLGEVATVMDYVADRLGAADRTQGVRERQQHIIAMLDRLIEEQEQQEQQGGGGRQSRGKNQPSPSPVPGVGKDRSDAPAGAARLGDLHAAPEADPGEVWGKLPPAERERILQSIRERYPSRYRQLVEQYYRALAEEK
jgi:tetratricopeptide (TPR) repeat protein